MLEPPPAPPSPGLSPPAGDMESDPRLVLGGAPTLEPGRLETMAPLLPLPLLFGGVMADPGSRALPSPGPFRPSPEPTEFVPPLTEGGGGTTLLARVPVRVPAPPPTLPVPPPAPESVGGGGTTVGFPRYGAEDRERPVPPLTPVEGGAATFASSVVPMPLRLPRVLPVASSEAAAVGGATTLAGREGAAVPGVVFETEVGGATTSAGPKMRPIRLPINDPLPDWVGGGGTTVLPGSGTLPLARWRTSEEMSVEGGGATTAGAGSDIREARASARSGAETGGGTTAGSIICTGAEEI